MEILQPSEHCAPVKHTTHSKKIKHDNVQLASRKNVNSIESFCSFSGY